MRDWTRSQKTKGKSIFGAEGPFEFQEVSRKVTRSQGKTQEFSWELEPVLKVLEEKPKEILAQSKPKSNSF